MPLDNRSEQRHLLFSILVTVVLGGAGVIIGLLARSRAIVFDGMYSLVDVVITSVSLVIARLIATEGTRRFQYGFWHLEPLIEAFGGAALGLSCLYATLTAIADLRAGGSREVQYGAGMIWAALTAALGFAMAWLMHRASRRTASGLLAMDARGWLVSGGLSVGLLVGFSAARIMADGPLAAWVRYCDGLVLLVVSLALLPVPFRSLWHAAAEVGQMAPAALDARVAEVLAQALQHYGFTDFTSYVTQSGRARFVDIQLLAPPGYEDGAVDRLDALRNHIAAAISDDDAHLWLTVSVTCERRWM
ncbi:cation transporter [Lysobacter sp. MMG2]|uniref:cation diffusion facilitator family transporter n=1 Tax=Lysobacter sp. MMG2 TaxID=2801338 RepID=UPI001C249F9A|nr:cation transporter [Lysobacter sp. MMG2]MBU8977784.1 cation transporter [Lysobacter sp. MMG2]